VKTRLLDDIVAQSGGKNLMPGMPVGRPDVLASRVVDALERDDDAVFYPSVYAAGTWFMGLSRWLIKTSAPSRKRA